jgi:hypothetical protein
VTVRAIVALVAAALACVVGALILGEYEFTGATPIGAGVLFGLVISEILIEIGAPRHPAIGLVGAAMVAGALAWAAWYGVSAGEGLRPFPTGGWVAMVCGAVAVAARSGGWRRRREDVRPAD